MFDGDRELAERLLWMLQDRQQQDAELRKQAAAVAEVHAQHEPEQAAAAAMLRSLYAPKQAAFFRPGKRWKATRKTRRAGITTVGVREMLARAIEIPGFRATYVASTRGEAEDRAWKSDTKSGLIDVLVRHAERIDHPTLTAYSLGGVAIEVRAADLVLQFSNGSEIELFGVADLRSQRKKRGGAKHLIWIDEAQEFAHLEEFFDSVIVPMSDFGVEVWMTGTPGRDCAGMFYEITKEPEDGDTPMPGWEVHELAQVDNPFFGHVVTDTTACAFYVEDNLFTAPHLTAEQRAEHRYGPFDTTADAEAEAVRVRWEQTAGEAMRLKGWKGDEPQFVREFLGKWVKTDARYVYPVHGRPRHELFFAPQRLRDNPFVGSDPRFDGHPPWYDHVAAVRDLPRLGRDRRPHEWLYSLWFDFGFWPDPFACVLWAFTTTFNHVYEMFSWKQTKVHADDQARYIKLLWDVEPAIVSFGGDSAGKEADFAEWKRRLNLPLEPAHKQGKETLAELLAGDIRGGLVHLRDGSPLYVDKDGKPLQSPLYTEMRHLVYLPTAPGKPRKVHKHRAVSGVVHGDHCCLVTGTMVETASGPVPIECVRLGDLAWTRAAPRPVTAAFSVGVRPTLGVDLDTGATLVGTADHPVWTERGWVPLAELMPGDTLTTWASTAEQRPSSSTAGGIGDIPTPSIEPRASTSREPSSGAALVDPSSCTEPSGRASTDPSPRDSTCTIETTTRSTTTPGTSSSCPETSTPACTPANLSASLELASASPRPSSQLRHGIAPPKDELGMPSSALPSWPDVRSSPPGAFTAEPSSRPRTPTRSTAPTPVGPPRVERAEPTMSTASAPAAEGCSARTATRGSGAAPTRVLRVYATGKDERVFNLTVSGEHEYFANGVLVSNCDAGRYGFADLTHYLAKLAGERPPSGSREAYAAEEAKIERSIEEADRRREERLDEQDELAAEYGAMGDYDAY